MMIDPEPSLVFLLDVDNTLLDNDRFKSDLANRLDVLLGSERAGRFWQIYEQVRQERDYVDYPLTVQRFTEDENDPDLAAQLQSILDGIDFASYLYPHVLEVLAHMQEMGTAVILSDGDQVFQRKKIVRSGLEAAVKGNVLIYVHKEKELDSVFARYPAGHYVSVDDKPRILAALEECCATTFTTIFVRQGKYASEGELTPPPDYTVSTIAELTGFTRNQFLGPSPATGNVQ